MQFVQSVQFVHLLQYILKLPLGETVFISGLPQVMISIISQSVE